MTVRVGIVTNPLEPSTWEEFETDDVHQLLREQFPSWPSIARVYDLEGFGDWTRAAALIDATVLARRDVTPNDEAGAERLGQLKGPLLVLVPPGDPITAIIAVVAIVVGLVAAFLLMPRLNLDTQRQVSPNNALADRTNKARPNGRITDIFGTVESVPDLLAVPYSIFNNNVEIEVSYMLVGRGQYAISRIRDGDTSLASISGASAAVYGPFTSPNSGDAPQLQIGPLIPEVVRSVVKLNDVNGQVLRPTNVNNVQGEDNIRFVYPDVIETNSPDIDFTTILGPGDSLMVQRAGFSANGGIVTTADARFTSAGTVEFSSLDPSTVFSAAQFLTITNGGFAGDDGVGGIIYVDLSGTYLIDSVGASSVTLDDPAATNADWNRITDFPGNHTDYGSRNFSVPDTSGGLNMAGSYTALSVSNDQIVLNNPALVNANWNDLDDLPGGATDYISPVISRNTESWIGPFIIDLDDTDEIIANIVALNGLFVITKKGNQYSLGVDVTLEATPVNSNDAPIGPAELFLATLFGSNTEKSTVAISLRANPTFSGRCSVRVRRSSAQAHDDNWVQQVDEIKWRDCYGTAPVAATDFGNVTTVMTRTIATAGALAVKSRKLNMRVTRKLPERISGSSFGPPVATDSAADIIAAMATDPFIGRRSPDEIDYDSIYDTIADVGDYFGSPLATQFGYTFDDVDVSFEEMVQTVAQAVFCTAYRQGRVMRLTFERATENSTLIFNARNTIPGTQKRTVRFGPLDDHDGIELDYVDPVDGAPQTFVLPTDGSAISARSVEMPGVRSYELAYWQAYRADNKTKYQNIAIELEATAEAALVLPHDRILIADRNRPSVLQGEVKEEAGTILELSQAAPLDPANNWTIFLQHIDGTIEPLDVTAGADDFHVVLASAPRMPLAIDQNNFANATYMIAPDEDSQTRAFLLMQRDPQPELTERLSAIGYSFLYYQHDELVLWLDFAGINFYDSGPYFRDGIPAGGAAVVADEFRGLVMEGAGPGSRATFGAFTQPVSYTKSAWIKRADLTTAGSILGSAHEIFGFAASAELQGGHDSVAVSAPWPNAGEWHYVALTYDADAEEMALYVNGRLVDSAEDVPARVLVQLVAFDGLLGSADDLRLWKRALTATEILSMYRSTRSTIGGVGIGLEGGGGLLTEDGGRLILE